MSVMIITMIGTNMIMRGTPVIINDIDAPEAMMVAVIINYNKKHKYWKARYLSNRLVTYCYSSGILGGPTPISDFGVEIDWIDDDTYQVIPTGKDSIATYRDGKPRFWQEPYRKHVSAKKMAKKVLTSAT